ncbi:MAG: lipopolysaccharide transport periplasmic protein LptA [Deltaproteobacteria bacterium]|nr:MAG: lipopolysaccharide transport periplasmic protein LptA [Deltaproteobacteria bacterium]
MSTASYIKALSIWLCLFLLPLLLLSRTATGTGLISGSQKNPPIVIKSDRLEVDDELKLITFTGNVVATKQELKIKCKKMVIYYAPTGRHPGAHSSTSNKSRISKIVATGDVKIYRGKQGGIATSDKAIYYQEEDKLVLTGRPMVKQGRDFVEGERITIYLKENRSVVESSKSKPVKAIIFPKSKKK